MGQAQDKSSLVVYQNNDQYQGQLSRNKGLNLRHGKGTFRSDWTKPYPFEYTGEWSNNKRHGYGRCLYQSGDLYEGMWQQGQRHGSGTLFSDTQYVGMWKEDKRHGQGTEFGPDYKFIGFFYEDLKDGQADVYRGQNKLVKEVWEMGKFNKTLSFQAQQNCSVTAKNEHHNLFSPLTYSRKSVGRLSYNVKNQQKFYLPKSRSIQNLKQQSSVEKLDAFYKVASLISKAPEIQNWTQAQVEQWLEALNFTRETINSFNNNEIDGYTLLTLSSNEINQLIKVDQQLLTASIKQLITVWSHYGRKQANEFFQNHPENMQLRLSTVSSPQISGNQPQINLFDSSEGDESKFAELRNEIQFDELIFLRQAAGMNEEWKIGKWLGVDIMAIEFQKNDFIEHAQNVQSYRHPNLMLYLGYSASKDGSAYLIFQNPSIQGGSLRELARQNLFSNDFKLTLKILKQIAQGLNYLHQQDFVVDSITPSNILIDDQNNVKICISSKQKPEKIYQAPEVLRAEPIVKASNVYNFGVIIYQMLNGDEMPYKNKSNIQVVALIGYLNEQPFMGDQLETVTPLQQMMNNCLLFEASCRPRLVDLIAQIEIMESMPMTKPTQEQLLRFGNLRDFFN